MRKKQERFGQVITADHLFRRDPDNNSFEDPEDIDMFNFDMPSGDTCALVILDNATDFLGFYTQKTKSKEDTLESFRHYQGPGGDIQLLYCDNAGELVQSGHELG